MEEELPASLSLRRGFVEMDQSTEQLSANAKLIANRLWRRVAFVGDLTVSRWAGI